MNDGTIRIVCAILGITTIVGIAIAYGFDGYLIVTAVGAIAGLGGLVGGLAFGKAKALWDLERKVIECPEEEWAQMVRGFNALRGAINQVRKEEDRERAQDQPPETPDRAPTRDR